MEAAALLCGRLPDSTGPVITLNGEATVTHEAGSAYKDSGANVADAADKLVEVIILLKKIRMLM